MTQTTAFTIEIEFFKLTFKKSEASVNNTHLAKANDRIAVIYEDNRGETKVDVRSMKEQIRFWSGMLGVDDPIVKQFKQVASNLFPDLFSQEKEFIK